MRQSRRHAPSRIDWHRAEAGFRLRRFEPRFEKKFGTKIRKLGTQNLKHKISSTKRAEIGSIRFGHAPQYGYSMSIVIGWDIGGVHLKAARAESGRIVKAVQLSAPLRGGVDLLAAAFGRAKTELGISEPGISELGGTERQTVQTHVATMTGELADTFSSRAEGVECLATLAARELNGAPLSIYAGPAGYVAPEAAHRHAGLVASANWHACASFVATRRPDALFIDMGSTTTDVIPIAGGAVAARGYTDAERLASGELVYTGLVRSFLMASAERAPFNGAWTTLIVENFASMADVHRILGTLPESADMMGTADGREKTRKASLARLARMIGADAADATEAAWTALAQWFGEMQVRRVVDAAMLVNSSHALPAAGAPVVGAGAGARVVKEIARRLGRDYVAFDDLLDAEPGARAGASQCAPAAALALLNS
jgi:probable H4MPT-linked C1 transfer pathway protein